MFDAVRIRANIEIRNAQQEQALTEYEKTVLTALSDVEKSLVNYAQEQVRYRTLSDAVTANRRALTMAQELYIRGLNDYLNVLKARPPWHRTWLHSIKRWEAAGKPIDRARRGNPRRNSCAFLFRSVELSD